MLRILYDSKAVHIASTIGKIIPHGFLVCFYCCDKDHDKKLLGKKKVYFIYFSIQLTVHLEGKSEWTLREDPGELNRGQGGTLLTDM